MFHARRLIASTMAAFRRRALVPILFCFAVRLLSSFFKPPPSVFLPFIQLEALCSLSIMHRHLMPSRPPGYDVIYQHLAVRNAEGAQTSTSVLSMSGAAQPTASHHEKYGATGESVLIPGLELSNETFHELKKVGGASPYVAMYHAGPLLHILYETRGQFLKNGSFLLKNLTESDSGIYEHVMNNERRVTTNLTVIDVVDLPVLHVEYCNGCQVLLTCVGSGENVAFFLDGVMINKTTEADNVLLVPESQTRLGGNLTCKLSNKVSCKTSTPIVIPPPDTTWAIFFCVDVAALTGHLCGFIRKICVRISIPSTAKCFTYKPTGTARGDLTTRILLLIISCMDLILEIMPAAGVLNIILGGLLKVLLAVISGLYLMTAIIKRFGLICNDCVFRGLDPISVILDVGILVLLLFAVITMKDSCPHAVGADSWWKILISVLIPLVFLAVRLICTYLYNRRKQKKTDPGAAVRLSGVESDGHTKCGDLEPPTASQRDPASPEVDESAAGFNVYCAKRISPGGDRDGEETQG